MHGITAFAAVLAVVAAAPGDQAYGYGKEAMTTYPASDCYTTSTCEAVYTTYSKEVPTTAYETKTTTVYQPYTTTVYNEKTIVKTAYVPSEYVENKPTSYETKLKTKTQTVETVTTTYVTTYLVDSYYHTTIETEKPCTYTTEVAKPYTTVINKPSEIVTLKPEIQTMSHGYPTSTYSLCTEAVSTCKPETVCPTPSAYPVDPKPYAYGN